MYHYKYFRPIFPGDYSWLGRYPIAFLKDTWRNQV